MTTPQDIRRAAEAASKGERVYLSGPTDDWGVVRGPNGVWITVRQAPYNDIVLNSHRAAGTDPWGSDARFIAAADPTTILSLLDQIDALTAERDRLRVEGYARVVAMEAATEAVRTYGIRMWGAPHLWAVIKGAEWDKPIASGMSHELAQEEAVKLNARAVIEAYMAALPLDAGVALSDPGVV